MVTSKYIKERELSIRNAIGNEVVRDVHKIKCVFLFIMRTYPIAVGMCDR